MNELFWNCFDALQSGQRRIYEAQLEYLEVSCFPPFSLSQNDTDSRMEGDLKLLSGLSLVRASADAQIDLLLAIEKWLCSQQKGFIRQIEQVPSDGVALSACMVPVDVGMSGYLIASRATRQISHFASTRFSYATLMAVKDARSACLGC